MQKTPFKNINWLSFYDQMNSDFRFFIKSVKMAVKYFSKKRKILHFWMDTGCLVIGGWANILWHFSYFFKLLIVLNIEGMSERNSPYCNALPQE